MPLTTTAQEELAQYVADQGLATPGRNLFAGRESVPPPADPSITFYNVGAEPPTFSYGQRRPIIEHPRVRVWVRAKNYGDAQTLALQLYEMLDLQNVDISGRRYEYVMTMGEPMSMGVDSTNREQISFSLRCKRNNN